MSGNTTVVAKPRKHSLGFRLRRIPAVRWTRKFYFRDPLNFEKQKLFWRVMPYTMCSYERLTNVYDLARDVERRKLNGAFVECGVWKGGCSAIMGYVAQQAQSARKLWLFDSFEGLPEPTDKDGTKAFEYAGGRVSGQLSTIAECVGPLDDVKRVLFSVLKFDEKNVVIRKGWFQDTLPSAKGEVGPIAILRLDGDWYESTKSCLDHLYDNLVSGGYLVIDDYGAWEGCKRAVDEFFQARGLKVELVTIDETGMYFQKP